jgi:hypothetical protein
MHKQFLLFLLLACWFTSPAFAQLHWHLGALPSYNYKAKIKPYSGNYPLRAFPAPGWQGKFGAGYTFGKNELLLDWYIGQEMMYFNVKLPPGSGQSGFRDLSVSWLDPTFLYNSVLLQYRRAVLERKSSVVRIGISAGFRRTPDLLAVNHYISEDYIGVLLDSRPQFIPEFALTIEREWWTRGGMHFAYGLESHLPARPVIASGIYVVYPSDPGFNSDGYVSLGGGYTGFSFSYIFRNRQERRASVLHDAGDTTGTPGQKRALRPFGTDFFLSYSQRLVFPTRWRAPVSGVKSTPRLGFEFILGKRFPLNSRSAFSVEFSYALLLHNVWFKMDTTTFPSLAYNVNFQTIIEQHQLQVAAGYHHVLAEGKHARLVVDAGTGLALSRDTGFGFGYFDATGHFFFKEYMNFRKHRIAPLFRLGLHTEVASNHGTWFLGADVSLLPFRRANGPYLFMENTPQEQRGKLFFSGSSAGVRIGYLFSRRKK